MCDGLHGLPMTDDLPENLKPAHLHCAAHSLSIFLNDFGDQLARFPVSGAYPLMGEIPENLYNLRNLCILLVNGNFGGLGGLPMTDDLHQNLAELLALHMQSHFFSATRKQTISS